MSVSSYDEFKCLLDKYAHEEAAPVSFNVSNKVETESYDLIMNDLLDSNSKWRRRDKIKHPRSGRYLQKSVTCKTIEEIKNVYHAIGPYWRVKMRVNNNPSLLYEMDSYRIIVGILDDDSDPKSSWTDNDNFFESPHSPGIYLHKHTYIHICFCIENELNMIICVQNDDD